MFDTIKSFGDFLNAIWGVFISIGINDVIDIAILSFIIYHAIKLIRETRALQLVQGIFLLIIFYVISIIFSLQTIRFLLKSCFQWGLLALVILFQPELRRMIEKIGRAKLSDLSFIPSSDSGDSDEIWTPAINAICEAVQNLSATCTGALIICERKTRLGEQIDTGTILNCTPSAAVFGNIFYPNTPLHDGAVIMRDGRILAAGCKTARLAPPRGYRHERKQRRYRNSSQRGNGHYLGCRKWRAYPRFF